MKTIKLLLTALFSTTLFIGCYRPIIEEEIIVIEPVPVTVIAPINTANIVSDYDLWYVDVHSTRGSGDIPFLAKAFTVSFLNGTMYANNNIVDVGKTGNGLGIVVGNYGTRGAVLEADHRLDGSYDFRVVQLSSNEIRLDDLDSDLSYVLVGYQRNEFDYDKLFYDNIEYFLQEYIAWEKISTINGTPNAFDKETYLQFTPENNTTFRSSKDRNGLSVKRILWDFKGNYEIFDIRNRRDLKILELQYNNQDNEEFELSVTNDRNIRLYHLKSRTTYNFTGLGFVKYLKNAKAPVRNINRKRTKVTRKIKNR